MEPFSFIIQVVAAAAFSAMPVHATTVPGTIDMVNVSNTSVITQTATQITTDKAAQEKAIAEAVAKAVKDKAEKTEKETKDAAKAETAKTAEKEKLHLPLDAGAYSYTSDFGLRCAPVTGAGNFHYGMDLAAPLGTPMYSIADGTVTSVTDGSESVGGDVQIESTINGKLMTLRYHHMGKSSQYVKVGDKIKAGHHISDVGSTGMSTGPHLHIEVFEGKFSEMKRIDPEIYFTEIGLDVVGKASANYVNKNDHPASCPGGFSNETSLVPASSDAPATTSPSPSAPSSPASPAPVAPAPSPAAPKPATPTPTQTQAPKPTPTPTPVPVPVPTTPTAIPNPSPSSTIRVTVPAVTEVAVTVP